MLNTLWSYMSYLLVSAVIYYFYLNFFSLGLQNTDHLFLGFMPQWVSWTMGGWLVLMVILSIWVKNLCKFFDESQSENRNYS